MEERKYAGLLPEERTLWNQFLEKYPDVYSKLEYNVRVGKGITREGAEEDSWSRMYRTLTKKRIDVVGHTNGELHLIEIRPRITLESIGRLGGYKILYQEDFKPGKPIKLVVICNRITIDDQRVCDIQGVKVYTLPD